MRWICLALAALGLATPRPSSGAPSAVGAWFTDAEIADAVRSPAPLDPLPRVDGTNGAGVALTHAVAVENPIYDPQNGLISFWIRPHWDGNDGRRHPILRVGDPGSDGLLVEKAPSGMLRYVVRSPNKATAARYDVSDWRPGEWHHVAVSWLSLDGRPIGLPLWVDRVCVDGPIFGASGFPHLADTRVFIGDRTSEADMDELWCHTALDAEGGFGQLAIVWRDWFRTAPYDRVEIDLQPHHGPMDSRVVLGCEKQYGLLAERNGVMERVTDFAVRYNQWSYYDAKPFIRWTTSDSAIATVDENGRVTGRAVGECALKAEYRGMEATHSVRVIPIQQPDLDILYVERLPKYNRDAYKNRPAAGDRVESVAHIANFGYATAPEGAVVTLELIPDRNANFRLDPDEKPRHTARQVVDRPLEPRDEVTLTFPWTWTDEPTWVRVAVDPEDRCDEICEANNERCDLNIARPLEMAVNRPQMESFYTERKINHIGSFSEYDWTHGQLARFQSMLRSAVYPTTSPDGVRDAFRIDRIYVTGQGETKWEDEPYARDEPLYDGGFPVNEPIDPMAVDAAILHEYGHTCASLPDLYGYGVTRENVFLVDARGAPYAGGDLMPVIDPGADLMPLSPANNVACGTGMPPLMDMCSLWLAPFEAGSIQYFAGFRGGRFWGTQGRMMPAHEQFLRVLDIDDRPLSGAAVYVYGVVNTPYDDAGTKYVPDVPKFVGNADDDGRFRFPGETDAGWDDADTDAVDGAIPVWNPFGRAASQTGAPPDVAFTPNVWIVEGLLLVRVVSGEQSEFHWLPLTEFNTAFLSGERLTATLPVRTSLAPSSGVTPVIRPPTPSEPHSSDLRPVAVVDRTELSVRCGEEFTLDASGSHDPEGQALTYHWLSRSEGLRPQRGSDAVLHAQAPDSPMECEYLFYVVDGLRCSEAVHVRVTVQE